MTITPMVAPMAAAPGAVVLINCGGGSYTDPAGNLWSEDTGFSGGDVYATGNTILNTSDPALYQTVRNGNGSNGEFSYSLPVNNGSYTLRLHFAELYFTSSGQMTFNVTAQDQQLLTNFDVFAAAGGQNRALVRSFPVTITNGQLNLTFTKVVNNAQVSAIELVPSSPLQAGRWELLSYNSQVLAVHAALLPSGRVLFFSGAALIPAPAEPPDPNGDPPLPAYLNCTDCSAVWDYTNGNSFTRPQIPTDAAGRGNSFWDTLPISTSSKLYRRDNCLAATSNRLEVPTLTSI